MKNVKPFFVIIFVGCWGAASAQSPYFQCNVTIQSLLIYGDGTVNVRHAGRNDYTHICNLNEPREGVSIATCAMWASMLLSLKQNDASAQFYYVSKPEYDGCEDLPVYSSSPAPVYIGPVQ